MLIGSTTTALLANYTLYVVLVWSDTETVEDVIGFFDTAEDACRYRQEHSMSLSSTVMTVAAANSYQNPL